MELNFDFARVVAVVEDVIGQDAIQSRLNANAYREGGLAELRTAKHNADEAKMYGAIADELTTKAKELFKKHAAACEKGKVEAKAVLTIVHDLDDSSKVSYSYDGMAKELWRQVAEQLDMTQDVEDMEVFSGHSCTVIDLLNHQVTSARESEQIALFSEREHRAQAQVYFNDCDFLLRDAGFNKVVEQGKARSQAKKELSKAVATYSV